MTPKDEVLQKYVSTPEGRKKLAASMLVPVRCGGGHYVDGELHLFIGGWLIPSWVCQATMEQSNPWPAIWEYQRTHERYVQPERADRTRE